MGKRRTLKHSMAGITILASSFFTQAVAADKVVFGYRLDGWPVSATHLLQGEPAGVLGFCAGLQQALEQQGYALELQGEWFHSRFVTFAEGLQGGVGLECGPNSRTPQREQVLQPYQGLFSKPFVSTATKLLIRQDKVADFYDDPARIRIGVLEKTDNSTNLPVTTALIRQVFPTAQVRSLASRKLAVERLLLPVAAEDAIDAYASDEILLHGILDSLAEVAPAQRNQYSIEPPFSGFSREEYAIVVYNNPDLLAKVNAWLESPAGRDAAAALQPQTDTFTGTLAWLNRTDHLVKARLVLVGLALFGALAVMFLMWRSRRRPAQPLLAVPEQAEPVPDTPPVSTEAAIATDSIAPAETSILTPQQLRVARLWANGHQAGVIAKMLEIGSSRTVETHVRAVYQKTTTANRIELFKYLQERELL